MRITDQIKETKIFLSIFLAIISVVKRRFLAIGTITINGSFFNVLTSFIQAFCLLEQDIFFYLKKKPVTDRELPRLSSNYFTFSL